LIDMECVQFHPTGMAGPHVRGCSSPRRACDGEVLRNSLGERFMFNYVPRCFRDERRLRRRADKCTTTTTPDVAHPALAARRGRAPIKHRIKPGAHTPSAGSPRQSRRAAPGSVIRDACPRWYHQFMELAGSTSTREAMRSAPRPLHDGRRAGRRRLRSDDRPGLFAAGEVAAGCTALIDWAATRSRPRCLWSAPGLGAADYVDAGHAATTFQSRRSRRCVTEALAPFDRASGENLRHPTRSPRHVQTNVGIIRNAAELEVGRKKLDEFNRAGEDVSVKGGRV